MADHSSPSHFSGVNITAAFLTQRKSEPKGPLVRIRREAWGDCLLVLTSLPLLGESD